MVLLSDGDDNQSRAYLDDAIKMCQRAETIIYTISTNWTPSRGKGDSVLEKLSLETGGRTFFPPNVEDVSNSFHDIEEELRSQYALTYKPADFKQNGAFRTIYLFANDRRYSRSAHVKATSPPSNNFFAQSTRCIHPDAPFSFLVSFVPLSLARSAKFLAAKPRTPAPRSLFPVPRSLFPVPRSRSPLPVPRSLFPVPCSPFPVPCSLNHPTGQSLHA